MNGESAVLMVQRLSMFKRFILLRFTHGFKGLPVRIPAGVLALLDFMTYCEP